VFPIMPIHRLDELPTRQAILADITCDCDGKIDRFAWDGTLNNTLPVHPLVEGKEYYLGAFLVGAYQETLGDLHNLLGDTHVVSVRINVDGSFDYVKEVEGDSVAKDELLLQLSGREQLEAVLAAAQLDQITAQQALDQVFDQEDLARAQAQNELALARDELRKSEYDWTVQQEGYRASDDTIKRAKANVVLAQDRVDQERRGALAIRAGHTDRAQPARRMAVERGADLPQRAPGIGDAHQRRAELHRNLVVGAHAHTELREPVAARDVAQQREVQRGLLVMRRDAHESDDR